MSSRLDVAALGAYIREQREAAEVSLRQLAEVSGVSNPYLSQIERGLRNPSAEILGQIAKALRISAETLYLRAGLLDERDDSEDTSVASVIASDPLLTERQRGVLLDIYSSFVSENAARHRDSAESEQDSQPQTSARSRGTTSRRTSAAKTP